MEGRFFEPDNKICLIFCNEHYDKLIELPEFDWRHEYDNVGTYGDMPRAREWADEFEEGIKRYGFSADQIYRHDDVDSLTMRNAIVGANKKIKYEAELGSRTLLLCFYAGHGS